jgi:hypothetical protein
MIPYHQSFGPITRGLLNLIEEQSYISVHADQCLGERRFKELILQIRTGSRVHILMTATQLVVLELPGLLKFGKEVRLVFRQSDFIYRLHIPGHP